MSGEERLSALSAIRLLRAKAAELEQGVLDRAPLHGGPLRPIDEAHAHIALLASLLADEIERREGAAGPSSCARCGEPGAAGLNGSWYCAAHLGDAMEATMTAVGHAIRRAREEEP